MNTELLRRILDDARDTAAAETRFADEDEIRCLMVDLHLTPGDNRRIPFATSGYVQEIRPRVRVRKAKK